jgi:hypothetical protein
MQLGFELRLKTGFYETAAYDMLLSRNKLILSPIESGCQIITVPGKEILTITLKNEKAPEIEIQTWEKIYQGSLLEKTDFEKLIGLLKENLNVKIICEYEGGRDHA